MEERADAIVVLRHFDNAIDANIAKTKLDAYGIPCFLTEENMANLYPGQNLIAFKTRLHIFASDRERAISILGAENFSVPQAGAQICPKCESPNVIRGFPKRIADSFLILFFGVFLPNRKVSQCQDCGFEF